MHTQIESIMDDMLARGSFLESLTTSTKKHNADVHFV